LDNPIDLILSLGVAGFASVVVMAYLVFIWWLDRYEREPAWLVLLTFAWGALGGTVFSCVINSTMGAIAHAIGGQGFGTFATAVIIAPTVEEFMKGLILVGLVVVGNNVDNRTDGLIYGAATGLGFACVENLWYYYNNAVHGFGAIVAIATIRTLFTAMLHCTSSAMLGMAIGYARHRKGAMRWVLFPALGYFFAVLNHATWNGISTTSSLLSKDPVFNLAALLFGVAILVPTMALMFALTQWSLHSEHKVIRAHLLAEARRGVIPQEHADIIPFWLKRSKKDWLPPHVDKDAYIKAATLLAFRHHQLEIAGGDRRELYLEEIATYRQQVQGLLAGR
jgi:RsiW-degrading membrane proteinase PrsW (M82 family)